MRRSTAAVVVALATALAVVPATATTSSAADDSLLPTSLFDGALAHEQAQAALGRAQDVLSGAADTTDAAAGSPTEGTLAMRDLFAALPDLSPSERRQAHAVLARPTDGPDDPNGDGYTVSAERKCAGSFCIHWVPTTSDAPPGQAWVDKTLATMNQVWDKEVDQLGYRRPVRDGRHGGDNKFDVYLKDVGANGLYGYCAPEYYKPGRTREASGYCVLDNDFSSSQFPGARPVDSLRVTAAHEFFHAIQFGYDFKEDHWLMEATSTWMEERFADKVNDNRQYIPYGQVHKPAAPLDTFGSAVFNQYGNWPFFQYLSSHFGNRIVRGIWTRAGAFPGAGNMYSAEAVVAALRHHGGFRSVFARYAAGNLTPGQTYAEGSAWPKATVAERWTLSDSHPADGARLTVDHLASRSVVLKPAASLEGKQWRARVAVDGPARSTSPAVYVVVHRTNGDAIREAVRLDRTGQGTLAVPFGHGRISRVTVTAVNASTRFTCHEKTSFSCRGKPQDDGSRFEVQVAAFER